MTLGDFASSVVLVFWGWAARDSKIEDTICHDTGKSWKEEKEGKVVASLLRHTE